MRRSIRRVLAMPGAERRLLIEAVLALALARLALAALPFRVAMRWHGLRLDLPPETAGRDDGAEARLIGRAVARAARRLPLRAVCLQQAVAASSMLRRRGLPVEIHFGLARSKEGELTAHAWCSSAEVAVTGAAEADEYTQVAIYRSPSRC